MRGIGRAGMRGGCCKIKDTVGICPHRADNARQCAAASIHKVVWPEEGHLGPSENIGIARTALLGLHRPRQGEQGKECTAMHP